MGGRHVENLIHHVDDATVTAVMDPDPQRRTEVANASGATSYDSPQALIDDPEVGAVVIASPDATHAELAVACATAGKPVLCEKPLAPTAEEARKVVDAEAAAGGSLVQVGFMRRYDPEHVAVEEAINRGDIGQPLYFRAWHRNPALPPYPTTREVVISSAIHDLYSARWLLGAEISEISVVGTSVDPARSRELELQIITMRMSSGAIAVVEVNRDSAYGYEVGVEIVGAAGTVTSAPHNTLLAGSPSPSTREVETDWLERFADAYVLEARAWIAGVIAGRVGGPSAWDGYATTSAAEAAVTAITAGPQRVELGGRPD